MTASRKTILMEIKRNDYLRWLDKLKTNQNKSDHDKCCHFHRDYRHYIGKYKHLKEEIESLVQRGHLKKYVNDDR